MKKAPIATIAAIALMVLPGCDSETGPAEDAEPADTETSAPEIDSDTGPSDEDVDEIDDDDVADLPAENDDTDEDD